MCVKDGNVKENEGIVESAKEYQTQAEKVIDETIEACVNGDLSQNKAEIELAKEFSDDPNNFRQSMQALEDHLGTGKTIVGLDTRMIPEGRVNVLIYSDNTVKAFECHRNGEVIPVMPNHNFRPTVFGTKLRFVDDEGEHHRNAEDVAAANILREGNRFTVTGGNCPQVAKLVPDFEPDPSRK